MITLFASIGMHFHISQHILEKEVEKEVASNQYTSYQQEE